MKGFGLSVIKEILAKYEDAWEMELFSLIIMFLTKPDSSIF